MTGETGPAQSGVGRGGRAKARLFLDRGGHDERKAQKRSCPL